MGFAPTLPHGVLLIALGLLAACTDSSENPYASWPPAGSYFPWVHTPRNDVEDWEDVRWEMENWDISDPVMTALYVMKALEHRVDAPEEVLRHFEIMRQQIPRLAEGLRIAFVGDVFDMDRNFENFAEPAAPLLADAHFRAGNLETPTSADHPTEREELGLYAFNAPPALLDGLPLDLLQLNNNHSLDTDDLGLENTIAEVESRGLDSTGVDRQALVHIEDDDGRASRVAFLSYTWGINDGRRSQAGHELHIIPFGDIEQGGDNISLALVEEQVEEARAADAHHIIVMVHWGFEYEHYPEPHFMILARRIISLGVDLVVGHGPHVVQPAEICEVNAPEHLPGIGVCSVRDESGRRRRAAILYSLGNFGGRMLNRMAEIGLVATVSLDESGITGLGWQAIAAHSVEDNPFVVPLADLLDDEDYQAEQARLRGHLGENWEQQHQRED